MKPRSDRTFDAVQMMREIRDRLTYRRKYGDVFIQPALGKRGLL